MRIRENWDLADERCLYLVTSMFRPDIESYKEESRETVGEMSSNGERGVGGKPRP